MKIYIIGSLSQKDYIKAYAHDIFNEYSGGIKKEEADVIVTFVMPRPDLPFCTIIHESFVNIRECDLLIAVTKPDRSFGKGVSYELEYARTLGKEIKYHIPKNN